MQMGSRLKSIIIFNIKAVSVGFLFGLVFGAEMKGWVDVFIQSWIGGLILWPIGRFLLRLIKGVGETVAVPTEGSTASAHIEEKQQTPESKRERVRAAKEATKNDEAEEIGKSFLGMFTKGVVAGAAVNAYNPPVVFPRSGGGKVLGVVPKGMGWEVRYTIPGNSMVQKNKLTRSTSGFSNGAASFEVRWR
jgi:hypothetical protein